MSIQGNKKIKDFRNWIKEGQPSFSFIPRIFHCSNSQMRWIITAGFRGSKTWVTVCQHLDRQLGVSKRDGKEYLEAKILQVHSGEFLSLRIIHNVQRTYLIF